MVYIIVKRSERELRERAQESRTPGYRQGKNIDGYARDVEEADRLMARRGRDNPDQLPILCDDGGKAAKEVRDRSLRAAGYKPEEFE